MLGKRSIAVRTEVSSEPMRTQPTASTVTGTPSLEMAPVVEMFTEMGWSDM